MPDWIVRIEDSNSAEAAENDGASWELTRQFVGTRRTVPNESGKEEP
jgi:hypothetical protein